MTGLTLILLSLAALIVLSAWLTYQDRKKEDR